MRYALRVRDDADGHYADQRGKVMPDHSLTREELEDIRRAMPNGVEFEVVEVDQ